MIKEALQNVLLLFQKEGIGRYATVGRVWALGGSFFCVCVS